MKITIDLDDGSKQVFQGVTDWALIVTNWRTGMRDKKPVDVLATSSYSHTTTGIRETLKEMRQAEIELQAMLAEQQKKAEQEAI